MRTNFRKSAVGLLIISVSAYAGAAESSKSLAQKSAFMWSAFQCAAFSGRASDKAESDRLFNLGYEQGNVFLQALKERKIDEKDLSENTPIIVFSLLGGPSADFMLGRIYESAYANAMESVEHKDPSKNSMELQKIKAQNEYRARNCNLLGAH